MAELGKCPKCGGNIVDGKYGAYCQNKCGMFIGKAFGKELSGEEVTSLLNGEKVLLKGLVSKKSGKTYDMYIKVVGIEDYTYQKSDGTEASGTRWKYETSFPDDKDSAGSSDGTEEGSSEDLVIGDPLPFA